MPELDVAGAVLETIARHTGASSLSFALPLQPLEGGFSGQGIYAFRLEDPPAGFAGYLVLRLMQDDDRSRRESVVQAAVAELGFPTPGVRLAGEGGGALGVPFLIMDRARGGSLLVGLRGREKARAFRRIPVHLAAVMARLHELSPEAIQKRLTDRGWASDAIGVDSVLREIESLTRPVGIESFEAGLNWLDSQRPEPAAACLCHGDLHPQNLMLADGEVTAVLDWTNARIAEPILDVVYTAQLLEQMPIAVPWLPRPLIDALGRRTSRRFLDTEDDVHAKQNLRLPERTRVEIEVRSSDYIYAFRIPAFGVNQMAVPDLVFTAEFETPETSVHPLMGDQLCGYAHRSLRGFVIIEPKRDFQRWQVKRGIDS